MAIWWYFYLCYKTSLSFCLKKINKQLISLLVTFNPTAKGSKLLGVSILEPKNLRWRCLCWGEDVQNNLCFKPAVPLCHQHWLSLTQWFFGFKGIKVTILAGFSSENIHWDNETFSWTLWTGRQFWLIFHNHFAVSKERTIWVKYFLLGVLGVILWGTRPFS